MINISPNGAPPYFHRLAESWRGKLQVRTEGPRSERLVKYNSELNKALRADLAKNFHGKCGYCESPIGPTGTGDLDYFRPPRVYGEEARLDWMNLVYSCAVCNRNKASAFPLSGGAEPDRTLPYPEQVRTEEPLLLNPCIDEPSLHLGYDENGKIVGLSDRGMATIETLDLNRDALVTARKMELDNFLGMRKLHGALYPLPNQAYCAMKLQFSLLDQRVAARVHEASGEQAAFDRARDNIKTDKGVGLEAYNARPRYIESIHLENVGAIADLRLDLTAEKSSRTPCFALLGVNGVGKSTILKAVAATIAGETYAKALKLNSNSLLSHDASSGKVTLQITGYSHPFTLILKRGRLLKYEYPDAPALVLAYGATRLMATGRHKSKPGVLHAKVANLFDPFLPVSDALKILSQLPDRRIEQVRSVLDALLRTNPDSEPVAVAGEGGIRFRVSGPCPRPVSELSDGYQALIGMAIDIIDVMHNAEYVDMAEAKGIVLVDELGNHFHPEWKIRIVNALRDAFPGIQFIFSTHEPLCLRGLVDGEVAVLQRDDEGVYLLTDLPPVTDLRVDQLLTSEHFGLSSTLHPSLNVKIQRYHELLRNTERTPAQEAELSEAEGELSETKYLGGSQRERMLLKLLDLSLEPIARAPGHNVSAEKISARSLNRLKEILRAIGPVAGSIGAADTSS